IVGIGASAGGLEAFSDLLKYLPSNTGMAFIFVMHLSAEHKSVLSELLGRRTCMLVSEAKDGMLIEPDHVYVIPPDRDMSIMGGKLVLVKMKGVGFLHLPVDCLFRSLAEVRGNRAIGVILSGTATDGTLGAEAIKSEGGITLAQDPQSAKYDGMPQSAIAAGCIDFVLSPQKIAKELCNIAKHPLIASGKAADTKTLESITPTKGLEDLFAILRVSKGVDFTYYKAPTMMRRIERRMVLHKQKKIKDYVNFLRANKDEVGALYEDLLINVTEFFRDEKPFVALQKKVLPKILKNRAKDEEVRIWVPGCSSGEEVYSIAICVAEVMGPRAKDVQVRIFATDLSDRSIIKARRGVYEKNIRESVSPERLKRFFVKDGDSYKVSKAVRDMCIFSKQNLFNDPPFSNLDLISCRNLLIYLQPLLQKKIFDHFHYSLKPSGFLLLGISESAGSYAKMFRCIDGKQKIFEKKYVLAKPALNVAQMYYRNNGPVALKNTVPAVDLQPRRFLERTDADAMIERAVMNEYASAGALVNCDMEIVSLRGKTGRFLEMGSGKPSQHILKLVREGLLYSLRVAIHEAMRTGKKVQKNAVVAADHGRARSVTIAVIPVSYPSEKTKSRARKEGCFLVLFDETASVSGSKAKPKRRGVQAKDSEYSQAIEKELAETKEYLRTVTEEHEGANEELKAANEEIMASNEELQSANEELETSKEELQSSNEELITTNEEMQNRNAEISILNNDFVNLLGSINMPVIMMDTGLVIRKVTSQAQKALNIFSSDLGRPISHIKLNVDIPDLETILSQVIESLQPQTLDIRGKEDRWYSVDIKPYRTIDNKIDGVIVVFADITERNRARDALRESEAKYKELVENANSIILKVDTDGNFIFFNEYAEKFFGYTKEEVLGKNVIGLIASKTDSVGKNLEKALDKIYEDPDKFSLHINENMKRNGERVWIEWSNKALFDKDGNRIGHMALGTDITERKRVEEALGRSDAQLRAILEAVDEGFILSDEKGYFYVYNTAMERLTGYSQEEANKSSDFMRLLYPDAGSYQKADQQLTVLIKDGRSQENETIIRRKDGEFRDILACSVLIPHEGHRMFLTTYRDITLRKKAEEILKRDDVTLKKLVKEQAEELAAAEVDLERAKRLSDIGVLATTIAHELRNPLAAVGLSAYHINKIIKDPRIREDFENISNRILEADQIINNVLSYSKIKTGSFQPVNINSLLKECVDETRGMFSDQTVAINVKIDRTDGLSIEANQTQIKEIFRNILNNSFDSLNKNDGVIVIESQVNDSCVIFVIKDNGDGIDKEILENVFNPFFTTKAKGTGLGLAVCNQLVRLHSGKITVESDKGKGTVVTITLPLRAGGGSGRCLKKF
ncbi:MAG: PAS domain S-box protein, partial [Candidatus Omnitrophica bacterium]|nr:PAS domain S-box protein [Candidatus Omnitrophota bacterium]